MGFKRLPIIFLFYCLVGHTAEISLQNFSLPDIRNNQQVTLSDYQGKVVYLDFWASWCSSCAKALPLYKNWARTFGDDFAVVSVNVDEVKAEGILMAQQLQLDFPIAYDKDLSVAKMYQASVLPVSFIINRRGQIVYRHLGFKDTDAEKLERLVRQLLAN
ncbi:TlpA disulfide reductase family protein [uncultured Paraglaciecola sp.]|uniref:TlpA family protein disulfide reductase n=1 Tax=uncultured Paraglaciecola sp. TaxID=1765024 RepID=UPI002634FE5C|nr:TlpA disulfide reductase family protein [uncultured Paraglaciecola sp.]